MASCIIDIMNETKVNYVITDMGTGGAYCSNCNFCLDNGDPFKKIPVVCPKCNFKFTGETTYINNGGSD